MPFRYRVLLFNVLMQSYPFYMLALIIEVTFTKVKCEISTLKIFLTVSTIPKEYSHAPKKSRVGYLTLATGLVWRISY